MPRDSTLDRGGETRRARATCLRVRSSIQNQVALGAKRSPTPVNVNYRLKSLPTGCVYDFPTSSEG
ncbi:MAG TPA: hypothetical protein VF043_24830 [Ktedonobacteraceae bacterium]